MVVNQHGGSFAAGGGTVGSRSARDTSEDSSGHEFYGNVARRERRLAEPNDGANDSQGGRAAGRRPVRIADDSAGVCFDGVTGWRSRIPARRSRRGTGRRQRRWPARLLGEIRAPGGRVIIHDDEIRPGGVSCLVFSGVAVVADAAGGIRRAGKVAGQGRQLHFETAVGWRQRASPVGQAEKHRRQGDGGGPAVGSGTGSVSACSSPVGTRRSGSLSRTYATEQDWMLWRAE